MVGAPGPGEGGGQVWVVPAVRRLGGLWDRPDWLDVHHFIKYR